MFLNPVETGTHRKCVSRGKKWICGVGSFQRGSHSPKGHLPADLAMSLSIFVSPLFSHSRLCLQVQCLWALRSHKSRALMFASWKRFYAIIVTPGSKPNRLIWQQPFPGSTAVSTPGTLLAEVHWAGGIYFIFRSRLTPACEQKFLM